MFSHINGLAQSTQFVVDFLQFVFLIACGHYATAGLKPKFTVAADKRANGYGLVQCAIQTYKSDAAAIGTTVVWLVFTDEL